MTDFKDTYRCPDCRREGAPISDEASADEYRRGWHVTCPECGFSTSGRSKTIVMQALAAIHLWQARVDEVMGEDSMAKHIGTNASAATIQIKPLVFRSVADGRMALSPVGPYRVIEQPDGHFDVMFDGCLVNRRKKGEAFTSYETAEAWAQTRHVNQVLACLATQEAIA